MVERAMFGRVRAASCFVFFVPCKINDSIETTKVERTTGLYLQNKTK